MPWHETTAMSLKREFVMLATRPGANISALCRRFQISRPTGYKWPRRYRREGLEGLRDRSRRPHTSPNQTPEPIADAVCAVRRAHPAWGGRKIEAVLHRAAEAGAETIGSAGVAVPAASEVPAASTCQAIHHRLGEANALSELGTLDRDTGDTKSARTRLRRAIEIYREIQVAWSEGQAVDALADLEQKEGNGEAATEVYREALQLFRTSQNRPREAFALKDLAEMAVAREDLEMALKRFAAAAELFCDLEQLVMALMCAQYASICAAYIGDEETVQRWHDRASEWQAESDTPEQE